MLVSELSNFETDVRTAYFPEIVMDDVTEMLAADSAVLTEAMTPAEQGVVDQVELTCTHCYHSWTQTVTREDLMSGKVVGA
jgi:hypothetical protein